MSNLPEKMKAIVAYAPGDYRLEVVDTPHAGEGEMILKVEACGICAGTAPSGSLSIPQAEWSGWSPGKSCTWNPPSIT